MKEQQKAIFIDNIKSKCSVDEHMAKELADSLLEIHQLNTGINEQTLVSEVFLTKFALYLKIGKEIALDWVRKIRTWILRFLLMLLKVSLFRMRKSLLRTRFKYMAQ